MSRILIAWELGADYGHISTFLPIALEMKRRGHEPILVLRDLCGAEKILGGTDCPGFRRRYGYQI